MPSGQDEKLRSVVKKLCPTLVDSDGPVWLPDDAIMVSE